LRINYYYQLNKYKSMKRINYLITLMFLLAVTGNTSYCQWEKLIKKDLNNWKQLNGTARYELKKGVITGITVLNSPNSFICSRENYGDFILEYDFMVDPNMNSGVQIRSESKTDYQNGRVHGYQIEIDPSSRAWTAGIYDEGRRGWLYTLDKNPEGQKAYKANGWNHIRVEAIGNSIRTWLNGVPCSDLIDDLTPKGFIALQVHSIGKDSTRVGEKICWKNIRIISKDPAKYATPYNPVIPQVSFLTNTLSEREKSEGWKLLWDGKTNTGWRSYKTENFPGSGWEMKDGILSVLPASKEYKSGGDIISTNKYKNFELIADFCYTPGANSGIKYFIDGKSNVGCEYQILDDKLHPDAKLGINGNRTLAGLYDLIPPKNKRDNGPDQWNRATIIVKGNHVEHWLNGQMTVSYERGDAAWRALVATSKFKDFPGFGEAAEGHILLQDHGNKVSYKNIKIRVLE
jgi:hypothetical protein